MAANIRPASGKTRDLPLTKGGEIAVPALTKLITDLRAVYGGGTIRAGDGLTLSIGKRAARWVYSYMPPRVPGEPRENQRAITLGDLESMDLADARAAASAHKKAIRKGSDPVAEKRAAREALASNMRAITDRAAYERAELAAIAAGKSGDFSVLAGATLAVCVDAYMGHSATGSPEYRSDTRRHLTRAMEELGLERATPSAIQPAPVQAYLRKLGHSHKALPLHVHGSLTRFLAWLKVCRAVSENIMDEVPRPEKPTPRRTVYTAAEVQALWRAADKLPGDKGDYLRFSLLVPMRRQEIADLTAAHVHKIGSRLEIRLGGDETKNSEPLIIPLAPAAREIIERLLSRKETGYLFRIARGGVMTAWSKFATQIRKASGVKCFSFHHNRRLFTSVCAEQQAGDLTIIDLTLNHKSADARSGVRAHYMQSAMVGPRARLFARWEAILSHAAAAGDWPELDHGGDGGNVVSIRSFG